MFERVAIGWQLTKQSWQVLRLDKELLLFPLLSGMACLLVMASFALPLWATGVIDTLMKYGEGVHGGIEQLNQVVGYLVLFAFSLCSSALKTIIVGALYIYAAEGTVPKQFDAEVFRQAFTSK